MLELSHLDLKFLYFVARFLIYLALSSAIFKSGFTKIFEALDPAIYLLVADVMLYGRLTIVATVSNTLLDDLDSLFFSGIP